MEKEEKVEEEYKNNTQFTARELFEVKNGVDESIFMWFGYKERIKNNSTVKGIYGAYRIRNHDGSRSQKKWIDSMNKHFEKCLKEKGA